MITRRIKMDISLIYRIAAVGIIVTVINILLTRSCRDEHALMVTLAALIIVLTIVVQQVSDLFTLIQQLFGL